MIKNLFTFMLLLSGWNSDAQITFQKTFGGINDDQCRSIQQTLDSGYILTGFTKSFNNGFYDAYLIKADSSGNVMWSKTFGGTNHDFGYSVQQTADQGYIVVGGTASFGNGLSDVYLIKIDVNGDTLWSKIYGGTGYDVGISVQQTTEGGYIIGGRTVSFGAIGNEDIYLIRTNGNGDTLWTRTYGGSTLSDYISSVKQTIDGGFIICGYTKSFGVAYNDIYVIKTDSLGNTQWSKTYGYISDDIGLSIQQTNDSGFVIAGQTSIGGNTIHAYLIKTDSYGDTLWTKMYAGTGFHLVYSIQQTTDGGYILAGAYSPGAGTTAFVYLLKTDASGDTLWTKAFGGGLDNEASSVRQTFDGGYIIGGYTNTFGAGDYDVYVIKTDSMGNSGCYESIPPLVITSPIFTITNPATIVTSPPTIVTTPVTQVGNGGIATTLCASVGIQEAITSNSFIIFPNPSAYKFTISFERMIVKGNVEVVTTLGTKVLSEIIFAESGKEINIKNISSGIYFVKVFDGERSYCKKLIIEQN